MVYTNFNCNNPCDFPGITRSPWGGNSSYNLMPNSIFDSTGWGTQYCCDNSWEKQAWFSYGVSFFNAILSYVPQWCNGGGSGKAETSDEGLQADINSTQNDIDEALEDLGNGVNVPEEKYRDHRAEKESWYTTKMPELEAKKTEIDNYLKTNETNIISLESERSALKIKKDAGTLSDPAEILRLAELNQELAKYEEKQKELADIEEEIKNLKDRAKTRNEEIEKKQKEIEELIEQKNAFLTEQAKRKQAEKQALRERAYGTDAQRRNSNLEDENEITKLANATPSTVEKDFELNDIRKLCYLFGTTDGNKDPESKKKYAKALKNLDSVKFQDLIASSKDKEAFNLVRSEAIEWLRQKE